MLKWKKTLSCLCAAAVCLSTVPYGTMFALAQELQSGELPADVILEEVSVPAVKQSGVLLSGDSDGDGSVTDADVTALEEAIEAGTVIGLEQMDVNGDNAVDGDDLAMVSSFAAGDITYFPVGEVWQADVQFMTRSEWIHQLVTIFDMSVEDTSTVTHCFTDLGGCEYAEEIDLAANFGVFEIDGELFLPDEYVTREFAAHTLNYCMGFPNDVACTYSDKDDVYYQGDVQISVTRGWFTLNSNQFQPKLYMTAAESAAALADAKAVAASSEIDENHEDSIVYKDGVVVFEESAEVTSSGTEITVSGSTLAVSAGDNFVCCENGSVKAYNAVSVTKNPDGSLTIETQEPDLAEVIESIDIEGYASLQDDGNETYGLDISVKNSSPKGFSEVIPINDISLNMKLPINDDLSVTLEGAISNIRMPITFEGSPLNVEEFYIGIEADCEAKATLSGSLNLTESKTMQIASIPVQGCGVVNVNLVVSLVITVSGEIIVTYGFDFDAGVQYSSANGWRLVKNFNKKSFSVEVKADQKVAVKCAMNVDVLGKSIGSVYVMGGEKGSYREKIQDDGVVCGSLKVYAFAEAGASLSLFGKTFSKSYPFIDWDNSPFKFIKHWEAYTPVSECSYGDFDLDPGSGSYSGWTGYSQYGLMFSEQIPVTTIDTATVLTGDMTVENGLILNADLDLNGYTLTVNGDLTQNKGELYVHGGRAEVNGTYDIEGGSLRMEDKADYVYAESFRNRPANNLTAGTLEVTGEFYCSTGDFTASGTHTVILSGTGDQSVVIADSSIDFLNLTIKNSDSRNIDLSGFFSAATVDTEDKPLNIITAKGGMCPEILKCSELNAAGWFELYHSATDFKGEKIYIDGDLYLHGGIDLNGAEMTVTGDVQHDTGRLYVHGGTVKIMGSYSLENYETLMRYENGVLKMEHNTDYVYVGGEFKINTSMPLWPQLLNAGTLEIAGDFYSYTDQFKSQNTHKVILSGEGDQTVYFGNQNACFNNLQIKNSDARSIIIDGFFTVSSAVTCDGENLNIESTNGSASLGSVKSNVFVTGDFGFYGNSNLQGDIVKVDGYVTAKGNLTITGADVTVTGELTQTGGTLTITRGTLTLEDFYEQTGGTLYIKSGTLNAMEDCELNGIIKMDNQSGSAVFNGNFSHRIQNDDAISAGTLDFKGDITVYESAFITTGTSKTILSGSEDQTISIEYFHSGDTTYHFNELEILNSDSRDIIITDEFDANNVSCDGEAVNFIMDGGNMAGLTLKCSANVSGDFLIGYNTINLNGNTMKVDGDIRQFSGTLKLAGGQLYVDNYSMQTKDETASEGILNMTSPKDYFCVNGDFTIDTSKNHTGYLTAGTLEIKGDFYQQYTDGSTYAFPASGTHTVILSGEAPQSAAFDSYPDSHFNILKLTKDEMNYTFSSDSCWNELIRDDEGGTVATTTTTTTAVTTTTTTTETTTSTASSTSTATATDTTTAPPEIIPGDVNMDGIVTEEDAALVDEYYAIVGAGGLPDFSEQQFLAADMNGDSRIDSLDAEIIRSMLRGEPTVTASYVTEVITTPGYYFSHDNRTFSRNQIVSVIMAYEYSDGTIETVDITPDVDFGGATPESTYLRSEIDFTYEIQLYYNSKALTDADGNAVTAPVYIGVKGDADLNNEVDSLDASIVLSYYARVQTSVTLDKNIRFSQDSEILDEFAAFLADYDANESDENNSICSKAARSLDALDASSILTFYAEKQTVSTGA